MRNHKLIISSAGSGKTSFLVKKALENKDQNTLITTYTENNEKEIKNRFIKELGYIPRNVTVQTWFSFLIQHGLKPFQGTLNNMMFAQDITGLLLVQGESGIKRKYTNEQGREIAIKYNDQEEFRDHYFSKSFKIYSDKLSKYIFKLSQIDPKSTFERISKIFNHIMIDEVQDLAGHDLEIIKLLMKNCAAVTMVGDPRQVTYLTHLEAKHKQYQNGKIASYLTEKCKSLIKDGIDETTLVNSHRNATSICTYSSKLYPDLPTTIACKCCHDTPDIHEGVFLIKPAMVDIYLNKFHPVQLRWNKLVNTNPEFLSVNFGESKGATFDRVLIYPTDKMVEWINDNSKVLTSGTRAKLYVGITRAKFSSAIVMDYDDGIQFEGLIKFQPE